MSVENALVELREERDEKALALLLSAWVVGRHASLAEAIGLISRRITLARTPLRAGKMKDAEWLALEAKKDPADIGRLLDTLLTHRSVEALARLEELESRPPDPRIALALAQWAAKPPYQARTTRPFWEKVHTMLQAIGDPVSRDVLEAGRMRYMTTLGSSAWAQEWFGKKADETIAVIPARTGDDPHRDALAEVTRIVGVPEARIQKSGADFEARKRELLDAVYDDPKDDARRHVLADWLQEHGDPRGELIALQMQIGGTKSRANALIAEHWREWLDGVPLLKKDLAFAKGFPDSGVYGSDLRLGETSPSWATLREIRFQLFVPQTADAMATMLLSPHVKSLVSVERIRVSDVLALARKRTGLPFERFVLLDAPTDRVLRDALTSRDVFPRLRELEFSRAGDPPLVTHLVASGLHAFSVEEPVVGAWQARIVRSPEPVVTVNFHVFRQQHWNALLAFLPAFAEAEPRLVVKSREPLTAEQRAFFERELARFAPGGVTVDAKS